MFIVEKPKVFEGTVSSRPFAPGKYFSQQQRLLLEKWMVDAPKELRSRVGRHNWAEDEDMGHKYMYILYILIYLFLFFIFFIYLFIFLLIMYLFIYLFII